MAIRPGPSKTTSKALVTPVILLSQEQGAVSQKS